MPKAYSGDLRERVIEAVETGASRREAAERFGSISPLEEFATEILALVGEQPDLTLVETVTALRKRRIKTSRGASRLGERQRLDDRRGRSHGRAAKLHIAPTFSADTSPSVSILDPAHQRATNALASVVSRK